MAKSLFCFMILNFQILRLLQSDAYKFKSLKIHFIGYWIIDLMNINVSKL